MWPSRLQFKLKSLVMRHRCSNLSPTAVIMIQVMSHHGDVTVTGAAAQSDLEQEIATSQPSRYTGRPTGDRAPVA